MKSIKDKVKLITPGFPYKPPVGCFGYATTALVFDDDKTILFDVGSYSIRQPLIKALSTNKIDVVVISHLHFDHCSNLDLFVGQKTEIIISKKEMEYYEDYKNKDPDLFSYFEYIKKQLNLKIIEEECNISANCKVVFTPGHTKGHISLEIGAKDKKLLLCGDCIKTKKEFKKFPKSTNAFNIKLAQKTRVSVLQKYNYLLFGHETFLGKYFGNKKFKIRRF